MDLSSIDMCFLLMTVEEMKKKVNSLCDIKKQVVADFSSVLSGLPMRQSQTASLSTSHSAPTQALRSQPNRTWNNVASGRPGGSDRFATYCY